MTSRLAALLLAGLLAPAAAAATGDDALWRLYEARGTARAPATVHRNEAGRPLFVNELVRERSPYLQDYAHSPIRWTAWRDGAAGDSRTRDALVFVSIGYSSCHWCHVMARESFDDLGVAALLNRGFVSVKIDSEERPDLDERFLVRLEALGISPGWPMNFVLTPEGEVLWGATYIGRDELVATLGRLAARWETDRPRLRQLAAARERQVREGARTGRATVTVNEAYSRQAQRFAADFDPLHKGFGTGRKFPAAAELGYLRDAYLRGAGEAYGRMFVETARAIASGGLHDAIDGGVFRYSTSRDWLEPHFEKMLYDQAQVARLMCQAHGIAGDASLARAARATLDFALAAFPTGDGLFASSFDAQSQGVEGGYYLWSAAELERLPTQARDEVASRFRAVPHGGRVLLVPVAYLEADSPAALEGLRALRKAKARPRRDEKAITAWNANMIAALAECGLRLGVSRYSVEAAKRMRRLLDANVSAGRIHRYTIAGERAGAGTIDDLGWLLAALASLHDADGSEEWMAHAKRLLADSLAIDDAMLARGLGDFARDRSAPASSAVLLQAVSRLARRSEDAAFRSARDRLAPILRERAGSDGFASVTAALHEMGSPVPGPVVHAAQGRVRVTLVRAPSAGPASRYAIVADIRPGWHINSHEPGPDYLRPTRIAVPGTAGVEVIYPPGKPMRFGPTGDTLSVLEGSPCFEVRVPEAAGVKEAAFAKFTATIQACTDRVCLRPETIELADPLSRARPCGEPVR